MIKVKYLCAIILTFFILMHNKALSIDDEIKKASDNLKIPLLLDFLNGDCDMTIDYLNENGESNEPWVHFQLGVCFEQQNKYDEAVNQYIKYVELKKNNANIPVVKKWIKTIQSHGVRKNSPFEIFLELLQKYQLRSAAKLFHQKPDIAEEELLYEIDAQQISMTNALDKLGSIGEYREVSSYDGLVYTTLTGGADIQYWESFKGNIYKQLYEVEFDNVGKGYIAIEFTDLNNELELRFLYFSLPMTAENKKRIISLFD